MVETIIVAVFIIGICTFLFSNFLPLIADYERVSNYDTVGAKYKTNEIRKMILREIDKNNDTVSLFTEISSSNGYKRYRRYSTTDNANTVSKNYLCDRLVNSTKYCNKLLSEDYLDVKEVIVTNFKLGKVKQSISKISGDRALKEYVEYLPSYAKYSSRYDSYYRIIVIFSNGEMSNIEVHYEIG